MTDEKQAVAVDLSHHLSELSKARNVSPLKGLQKYFKRPGILSLAGGMPDPAYFPFASLSGDALLPDAFPRTKPSDSSLFTWFWSWFAKRPVEQTQRVSIPKYPANTGDINLAQSLQYSAATGLQQLQDFTRDFTAKVYRPAYSNWATLAHTGNTDGINRALATFCNPGEFYLVEEWAYPSTLAASHPMPVRPVPIKIDGQGLSAIDLERVLAGWDEAARGAKRPHVMYTVPIGQNPTGATMGLERKKAIYAVCVKYDVIIIEDDPYFFLQEGPYVPKAERAQLKKRSVRNERDGDDQTRFIDSLTPSFLRVDTQGRVVRLDSFSKIVAPGSRMGWITANPTFIERLERQAETSTQAPSGFSQSLITQLIATHWGFANFVRWLEGIRTQYAIRRDFFVDCVMDAFDVRPAAATAVVGEEGEGVWTAYVKKKGGRVSEKSVDVPLFSFVPPSSGMFVWLKFHVKRPRTLSSPQTPNEPPKTLEQIVWEDIAEHGLLLVPGSSFSPTLVDSVHPGPISSPKEDDVHFRLSFSMGTDEQLRKAVEILASALERYV